ncbi:MAG: peptidoglycan DD-metalloendopeptidase family protein, partial [Myxococcales bacterium]|nr:peptidoglycan DD-metalloendopeptidase family protein [Myxococcales bacterium]
ALGVREPSAPPREAADPSWIGEADLFDMEDTALDAWLFGPEDAPQPERVDAEPAPLGVDDDPDLLIEDDIELDAEPSNDDDAEGPLQEADDEVIDLDPAWMIAPPPPRLPLDWMARNPDGGAPIVHIPVGAVVVMPQAQITEVAVPAAAPPPVPAEAAPRNLKPPKPIRSTKLRVVKRPSSRRWLYTAAAASVLIAGAAAGLLAVQTWRLEQSDREKTRLTRVSSRLALKVSETQQRFAAMTRELRGLPTDPLATPPAYAALFEETGEPMDESLLELAFRDLEMREQLGAVRDVLAKADQGKNEAQHQKEGLEAQVAALESRIATLNAEQDAVHERLASRLDRNIQAIETALTATGVDIDSVLDPRLGGTPLAAADGDEPPASGVGGPFIADGTADYVNPVPGETEVMSGFGPRGREHHNGIDIPAPLGTAVLAVSEGVVQHVQDRQAWESRPKFIDDDGKRARSHGHRAGIYVEIKHDDGRISRYMHLGAIAPGIEQGARVRRGQVLGSVGRTGVEHSETHLHFELRAAPDGDGRYGEALDPQAAVHADDTSLIAGTSLLHADLEAIAEAAPDEKEPEKAPALPEDEDAAAHHLNVRMDRLQSLEKLLRELPLVAPLDEFTVSSPFGRRRDPMNNEWSMHTGVDMPGEEGTPIRATAPGRVIFAGRKGKYGLLVEIDHGNGITTRYGHLSRAFVREGHTVKYRERIAEMGSSGRSTAPHLHYEVRVDDKPRDPMNFIQAGRYVFKR